IDVFDAAGIKKPDIAGIGILSDEFLQEVKGMEHKNLAVELLKKLLTNEIKIRLKTHLVKGKKLLEMLESTINNYNNKVLTTTEIIQELLEIAKEIRNLDKEGERL